MHAIKLRLWQEEVPLEVAFMQLLDAGQEQPVLRELGKRMLYLKGIKDYQIEPLDEKALEPMLLGFFQRLKLRNPEDVQRWMAQNRQTKESLLKHLGFQEQLGRLKKVVIPDEMLKEPFLQRKARLDSILFQLIRVDSEPLAQELYFRIQDDQQDFGELAKRFSTGPEAPYGGLVGPKLISDLNPELRKYLLELQIGELTPPFTLDGRQYLLARVVRVDHAQMTPAIEASLRDELFEQWTEGQLNLAEIQMIRQKETLAQLETSQL